MEKEEWKDIYVFNPKINAIEHTIYAISNLGRVKNRNTGKIKDHSITKRGYHYVNLHLRGKRRMVSVARLVAEHFIQIPEKYTKMGYTMKNLVVDHIREDDQLKSRSDNSIHNLQWLTETENLYKRTLYLKNNTNATEIRASDDLTGVLVGELNPSAIYTEDQIRNVCKDLTENVLSLQEIADKNNMSKHIVQEIKYKKSWTHISNLPEYNISNHTVGNTNKPNHSDEFLSTAYAMLLAGIHTKDIVNELRELYPDEVDDNVKKDLSVYYIKLRNKSNRPNSIYYKKTFDAIVKCILNGVSDDDIYNNFKININPRTRRDLMTVHKYINIIYK